MQILLITSGQPSLNPRLVKEADALSSAGYNVTVLYAYWNEWGTKFDPALLKSKKWKAIRIGGAPKRNKASYFLSQLIHKLATIGAKKVSIPLFAEIAIARTSFMLSKVAKKHQADLYIAHNLGALPAAVKAARHNHKPCGFDAEDFHRNEVSDDPHSFDVKLKTYIEQKYLPKTSYLTASSPQITAAYQTLFPFKAIVTLLNVFSSVPTVGIPKTDPSSPIKLFWFSQTIGTQRGIEGVIQALNILPAGSFELHLLGAFQHSGSKAYFEKLKAPNLYSLHFHPPIASEELITFSAQFDIGLALEPSFSKNNDLALSNKIFTYLQAGLAVIASDTTAQRGLLTSHPEFGSLYETGNTRSLSNALLQYAEKRDQLDQAKQASLMLARNKLNWEIEQVKFLKVIQQTLNLES
jgi:glycosyltransferase involved in cell wall biosynthesis